MQRIIVAFGVVFLACLSSIAFANDLAVGPILLTIGMDQKETMAKLREYYRIITQKDNENSFFLQEKSHQGNVAGAVAFKNGRLSWASKTWGSYHGNQNCVEVTNALYAAIESAKKATNSVAKVETKTDNIPNARLMHITFSFSGRKVKVLVTDGTSDLGQQVSISESISSVDN